MPTLGEVTGQTTLGDLGLGKKAPPNIPEPLFNFAASFNRRLAQTLAAPVELVDQALRLAGTQLLENPGDATKAVTTAFETVGIDAAPITEGLASEIGRNTFDSLITLTAFMAAAPTMVAQAAVRSPGVTRSVVGELGKVATTRPGIVVAAEAGAVPAATIGEREFGPTGAIVGGMAGGIAAGGATAAVRIGVRAIPVVTGAGVGALAGLPTGILGSGAGAIVGGLAGSRARQAGMRGLRAAGRRLRGKKDKGPLFEQPDEDVARASAERIVAGQRAAVTGQEEQISDVSRTILGKQKGLMVQPRDELFEAARQQRVVIGARRLKSTHKAVGDLLEELQPFKEFPEAQQAIRTLESVQKTLTANDVVELNEVFRVRQLVGTIQRRLEVQGGVRLGSTKKVFGAISDDLDRIATEPGLAGEKSRLFKAATGRAKLEFALEDLDEAVVRFSRSTPGEDGVSLDARGLRRWFNDITNPKGAKYDKNFATALKGEADTIRNQLTELEAGQLVVSQGKLARFAGRDAQIAVRRVFSSPDPATEGQAIVSGLGDDMEAVRSFRNQMLAELFRRGGNTATGVHQLLGEGRVHRLMRAVLGDAAMSRLERVTRVTAAVETGKLRVEGVRRPALSAIIDAGSRFLGAGIVRALPAGTTIQQTAAGAKLMQRGATLLTGKIQPSEAFALAITNPAFERLLLKNAPQTAAELKQFERGLRAIVGSLAGGTVAATPEKTKTPTPPTDLQRHKAIMRSLRPELKKTLSEVVQ